MAGDTDCAPGAVYEIELAGRVGPVADIAGVLAGGTTGELVCQATGLFAGEVAGADVVGGDVAGGATGAEDTIGGGTTGGATGGGILGR